VSDVITKLRKQELEGSLGKAALETLSIVLYRGPISRTDIDYIRGVNSQFILRRLSIRGLIEKKQTESTRGGHLYTPTIELLTHLGITDVQNLPEYKKVQESLEEIKDPETIKTQDTFEESATNEIE
jgi:segregation and condensation protein B